MTEFVWREERTDHAIRDALDRRHPERLLLRPNDVPGVWEGFDLVDQMWAPTIEQAQVARIDKERAGMLTPWLDELVALNVDGLRPLRAVVVAVKTFGLPERWAVEIVPYHRPSGSQLIIDAHGRELRRELCSVAGEQALTAILDDSRLLAMALELAT